MSTKPFKDIERMMKEAADGFEHPFEEESWRKMETLLDKEQKRKKPTGWLWMLPAFLVLGGAAWFYLASDWPGHKIRKTSQPPASSEVTNPSGSEQNIAPDSRTITTTLSPSPNTEMYTKNLSSLKSPAGKGENFPRHDNATLSEKNTPPASAGNAKSDPWKTKTRSKISVTGSEAGADDEPRAVMLAARQKSVKLTEVSRALTARDLSPFSRIFMRQAVTPTLDSITRKAVLPAAKTEQQESSGGHRWYLLATAGIESSGTRLLEAEKISPRVAMTVGYQITKRISLQTGFAAGRKKYVAGPSDYKAKSGTYWSTVNLTSVKANCLVYEIPLTVRYDFRPLKPTKIFASAGFSSYLMKRENYEYTYNRNGYTNTAAAGYSGNHHLFSVVKVAAGFERPLAKTLSLHASPAVLVPLSGIGEGEMKLYSTELSVGLRYTPIKKVRKQ